MNYIHFLNNLKFKKDQSSSFEVFLNQSSLLNSSSRIELQDMLKLIEVFEGKEQFTDQRKSARYYMQAYFQSIGQSSHTQILKFKALLTIHVVLNEFQLGDAFATEFLDNQFIRSQFSTDNKNILNDYFYYLQRIASNINIYHSGRIFLYPQTDTDDIVLDTKVLWLYKINNLLQQILSFCIDLLEDIKKNNNNNILRDIMMMLWSDILIFFNFLSLELMKFISAYRQLDCSTCVQYNELLKEHIQVNQKIKRIFQSRITFDLDGVVKSPKNFSISRIHMKNINDHTIRLRIQSGLKNQQHQNLTVDEEVEIMDSQLKNFNSIVQDFRCITK